MKLIDYVSARRGAQTELARAIGVPSQTVWHWAHDARHVPIHHCMAVEVATGGAVTRKDLRPDDWQRIWPEWACPFPAPKPNVKRK